MEMSDIFNMMLQNPSVGFCAVLAFAVYMLYRDFKSFVAQSLEYMRQLNETLVGLRTDMTTVQVELENVKEDVKEMKDK